MATEKKKKKPREIEFKGTNPLLTGNEKTDYQYVKGGILGLVNEKVNSAQYAAVFTKDDMQMVVVLMDSAKENAGREATSLFEYADLKVTKNTIVKKGKMVGRARVRGGAVTRVAAYTETKGFAGTMRSIGLSPDAVGEVKALDAQLDKAKAKLKEY